MNRRLAVLRRVETSPTSAGPGQTPARRAVHHCLSATPATCTSPMARCFPCSSPRVARPSRRNPHCGLHRHRLGEIVRLKPATDGDMIRLGTDTKTGKPRSVPIHPALGTPLHACPSTCAKAGSSKGFHHARRSRPAGCPLPRPAAHHRKLVVQAGVPLYTAGLLLGHASTKTTQRYAHLADETSAPPSTNLVGKNGSPLGNLVGNPGTTGKTNQAKNRITARLTGPRDGRVVECAGFEIRSKMA